MAKDRKKLQHIHSSVPDKQPTPASLEVGEIAVNNAENQEFISLKNTNDEVVRFSSDKQLITWVEKKEVIPYEGMVVGESGVNSSKDYMGSYGITQNDLINNKSNIIIKLNQVVASNTTKYDKVNGAKDIYNRLANPSTDGGINDGAGFAIDMSRYAMIGANPSFNSVTTNSIAASSVTSTCNTTLSGTTNIKGLEGDCGSLLDITVESAATDIKTASTTIASAATRIGTNSTTISGNCTFKVSGTTTVTKKDKVTINHSGTTLFKYVDQTTCSGSSLSSVTTGDTIIQAGGDMEITSNGYICETAVSNATFYGATTNIGLNCSEDASATTTNIYGRSMVESANTKDVRIRTLNSLINTANTTAATSVLSGRSLTITENDTIISSCTKFEVSSNAITFKKCSDGEVAFAYTEDCLEVGGCVKSTGFYQTSDRNLKENIAAPDFNKIMDAHNVPIVKFNFINDVDKNDVYGVIAQDVEAKNLNELIHIDNNGNKSVDYTSLMILKIAYLENELIRLKAKLDNLENNK